MRRTPSTEALLTSELTWGRRPYEQLSLAQGYRPAQCQSERVGLTSSAGVYMSCS